MLTIERKSTPLELSELNRERRTGVIAHAAYNNIDTYGEISRKGMFNKSWSEKKSEDIRFDIDHNPTQQPGKVTGTFEDEKKAYTRVKFGTHTLGNDTMLMMDEGIIRGASFEFITDKDAIIQYKGRKVRELIEVKHLASTVTLALPPVNPQAGVVSVTKAQIDAIAQFKAHLDRLEAFCRNTSASDDCIQNIEAEIKAARNIIVSYDSTTQPITEPGDRSVNNDEFSNALHLLTLKI